MLHPIILTILNNNFTKKEEKTRQMYIFLLHFSFKIWVTEAAKSKQIYQFNLPENLGHSFVILHPANC
jgi:hypothetical protein